jgi:hypothetical protein
MSAASTTNISPESVEQRRLRVRDAVQGACPEALVDIDKIMQAFMGASIAYLKTPTLEQGVVSAQIGATGAVTYWRNGTAYCVDLASPEAIAQPWSKP